MEFFALYFLVLMTLVVVMGVIPAWKRRKQTRELQQSIVPGDTVVTMGGIVARVLVREENTLILQLNENSCSQMRVLISAIQGSTQKDMQDAENIAKKK